MSVVINLLILFYVQTISNLPRNFRWKTSLIYLVACIAGFLIIKTRPSVNLHEISKYITTTEEEFRYICMCSLAGVEINFRKESGFSIKGICTSTLLKVSTT